MTVEEALELARRHGVNVVRAGDSLHREAHAPPPNGLLALLGRGRWDIVAALRQREAEERRRIVQWVNDHFASSPPGVCTHCSDGLRSEDPLVLLFVGNDRGEVHASCHPTWLAEREAGRCARGQRLVAKAPFGKWRTLTFLSEGYGGAVCQGRRGFLDRLKPTDRNPGRALR